MRTLLRTWFRTLPLLALLAAPLQVFGGTQATMQVSFTVLASCTVADHGATAPGVRCAQADGFLVAPHAAPSAATGWTVYF